MKMTTRTHITGVALLVTWFSMTSAIAETPAASKDGVGRNLIPNGSFEDDYKKGPEGWSYWSHSTATTKIQRGKYLIDAKVAHSGTCCVMAELTTEDCADGQGYGGWHPADIQVKPNTAYKLRAWLKVKMTGGDGKGAWFWIYGYPKGVTEMNGQVQIGDQGGVTPKIEYFDDVPEWREVEIDFVTGKEIDRFNVWLRLDGAGLAWFDDVSLVESAGN